MREDQDQKRPEHICALASFSFSHSEKLDEGGSEKMRGGGVQRGWAPEGGQHPCPPKAS